MLTFSEFVDRHMRWRYGSGENTQLTHNQATIVSLMGSTDKLYYVGPRKVGASSIAAARAVYDAAFLASRVVIVGPSLLHARIGFDIARYIATSDAAPLSAEVEKITQKQITFSSGGSISMCSCLRIANLPTGATCIVEHANAMKPSLLNTIAAVAGRVVAISTGRTSRVSPDLSSDYAVWVMQEVLV